MLIFLFLIFMITAKADEETKLIDLLPEEEKLLFLESVARRIHEEIQVDPINQKSVEVPDNELEIHDAFVRQILKEEQANLRKGNNNANEDQIGSLNKLSNDKNKNVDISVSRNRRQINQTKDKADSYLKNYNEQSVGQVSIESSIKSDDEDIQIKYSNINSKVNENIKMVDVLITTDKVALEAVAKHQEYATTESIITSNLNNSDELKNITIRNNEEVPHLLATSKLDAIPNQPFSQNNASIEEQANLSEIEKTKTIQDKDDVKHVLRTGNNTFLDITIPSIEESPKVKISKRNLVGAISTDNPVENLSTIANEATSIKHNKIGAKNLDDITEPKMIQENSNNQHETLLFDLKITPEPSVELVSKTKEQSNNFEIVSTSPEKIVDNVENGEIITKSIKSEAEAKEKNTNHVSEVTEKRESNKKEKVNETGMPTLEVAESKIIRINTVNFGEIVNSKAQNNPQTKENIKGKVSKETEKKNSDKEVKEKLSITTVDSSVKTNRINTLNIGDTEETKNNTADNNDTNTNLFMDIKQKVKKIKTLQSKTYDSNSKVTEKMKLNQIKDNTVNVESETEYKLDVTTQKVEVLTPLTPLTENNMQANKNEDNYTIDADNRIIRVLRDVIQRNTVKNVYAKGEFEGLKSEVKKHAVYEVPKILVLDNAINKENPYYYPTFNFSSDNAYYNPQNNYGPANDHEAHLYKDDADQGKDNLKNGDFNDNNPRYGYLDGLSHTNDNGPLIVSYLLNPHLVSYVTRTKDGVSENRDNSEENSIKSSLNQIRMMMFANKHFGPINEDNRTYSPIEVDMPENTTEKNNHRFDFKAALKTAKKKQEPKIITDDNNILVDLYLALKETDNQHLTGNFNATLKNKNDRNSDKNKFNMYVISPDILKAIIDKRYIARTKERKGQKKQKVDKNNTRLEKIQKVLKMSNAEDLMPNLNTLLKMNLTRSAAEENGVEINADVLTDMIQNDSRALVQFDWLGSTVNIIGAIMKLIELTDLVQLNQYIHPSDLELLKYTTYLYKHATMVKHHYNKLRMRIKTPKGTKKKSKLIKTIGLIDRVWLFRQSIDKEEKRLTISDVEDFKEFLKQLLNALYNLHTAVREIANITRHNNQHWFRNLKQLYLDGTRNTTLPLLLHLETKRVLDLIENSSKNGLELNFFKYIQINKDVVIKTKKEVVLLLDILEMIH